METISLKTFATTAVFGQVKIGSTKEEVISLLGTDYDFGDFNDSYTLLYGWYEFFFWTEDNTLFAIQNDSLSGMENDEASFLFKNDKFTIEPWFFKTGEKITYKIVQDILQNEGITYRIKVERDATNKLLLDSNVCFDFRDDVYYYDEKTDERIGKKIDNPDDFILNGIRIFDFG